MAVIRGGPDGYANTGHAVVRSGDLDTGAHFGSNLALLRLLAGDDVLNLVVAANGTEVERSVAVVGGDGRTHVLPGVADVVQGSGGGMRLGRTAGR